MFWTCRIWRAAKLKADVVSSDVKEAGQRAVLNFGHTVGHAIEAALEGDILHGEAVAIGMVLEGIAARRLGVLSPNALERLRSLLIRVGLPVTLPADSRLSVADLMDRMRVDKKAHAVDGGCTKAPPAVCVLPDGVGSVRHDKATVRWAWPVAHGVMSQLLSRAVHLQAAELSEGDSTVAPVLWRVPGSKSLTNRALLLAALGHHVVDLHGLLLSEDTVVMIAALKQLGVRLQWRGEVLQVQGCGGAWTPGPAPLSPDTSYTRVLHINVQNAGTAMRFLVTALCLLPSGWQAELSGVPRMHERPIGDLVDALNSAGQSIEYLGTPGFPPLRVHGGGLRGGEIWMAAQVSSQYVSSVMLAAPFADKPISLRLREDQPTSLPYIRMSAQLMRDFGHTVVEEAVNHYTVGAAPRCDSASPAVRRYAVEPDASSATYPLALAALRSGLEVECAGLSPASSLQGDVNFAQLLGRMGCKVQVLESSLRLSRPKGTKLSVRCAVGYQ